MVDVSRLHLQLMEVALFTDCGLIGRLGFQKPNRGLVELFYTYLLPINLKALRTDKNIDHRHYLKENFENTRLS